MALESWTTAGRALRSSAAASRSFAAASEGCAAARPSATAPEQRPQPTGTLGTPAGGATTRSNLKTESTTTSRQFLSAAEEEEEWEENPEFLAAPGTSTRTV